MPDEENPPNTTGNESHHSPGERLTDSTTRPTTDHPYNVSGVENPPAAPLHSEQAPPHQPQSPKPEKTKRSLLWLLGGGLLLFLLIALVAFVYQFRKFDQQIEARLSQSLWEIPARVYARPLELYPGSALPAEILVQELERLRYTSALAESPGTYSVVSNTSGNIKQIDVYTREFEFSDGFEAARKFDIQFDSGRIKSIQLVSESAEAFSQVVRFEPTEIGTIHALQHEDREPVQLSELPEGFVDTLIAVEDKKFYSHRGISLRGVLRATLANIRSGSRSQGASTITQQLVKNLFLSPEKTWRRKLSEMGMALLLERRLEKEEILELYINEVFLTQHGNRAIHGFGLASKFFFDKPLGETRPHEYALLIGMIKAPSAYNPERNPERATRRRNVVISVMESEGHVDSIEAEDLTGRALSLAPREASNDSTYAAYLDLVRQQLLEDYALDELQSRGLRIFTHLDPVLQQQASKSLIDFIASRDRKPEPTLQGAVLITDARTAEVKAIVGGRDSRPGGFNRALDARRHVGSVLKPAVFLTALEQKEQYTLGTLVDDEPVSLSMPNGSVWKPENFDKEHRGPVTIIDALADSLNLATINLALELGIDNVIKTLTRLGLQQELPEVPALALGTVDLSPLDVARMYQTIAANGYNVPLRAISSVTDLDGNLISQYPINVEQKFDSESMYLLRYALTDVMLHGTGRGVSQFLPRDHYVAGKTGTSNDQRDSWFAGFSSDYLGVVWLGNDEGGTINMTGSSGALRVWAELMQKISKRPLKFNAPDAIVFQPINPENGERVSKSCRSGYVVPYIEGTQPLRKSPCPDNRGLGRRLASWLEGILVVD